MPYFLGIDAGTTSMKSALFDESGRMLAVARAEYELLTPAPAIVECDAETYWRVCCAVVRQVVSQSGVAPATIATLAISSQAETLVLLDAAGAPTRRVIVWLDNRAVDEAAAIAEHFGTEAMFRISGQPEVVPTWPACKILWVKRNEPAVFAATAKFLLLEDYLLYRLTGEYVTEMALQSDSLLVDINTRQWFQPMLDYLGVGPEHFGRLVEPGALNRTVGSPGRSRGRAVPPRWRSPARSTKRSARSARQPAARAGERDDGWGACGRRHHGPPVF